MRASCFRAQVLACIGEQFTEGDEIHGIAVVIRGRGDRIEMWTRTASNEAAQVRMKARACAGKQALLPLRASCTHVRSACLHACRRPAQAAAVRDGGIRGPVTRCMGAWSGDALLSYMQLAAL